MKDILVISAAKCNYNFGGSYVSNALLVQGGSSLRGGDYRLAPKARQMFLPLPVLSCSHLIESVKRLLK